MYYFDFSLFQNILGVTSLGSANCPVLFEKETTQEVTYVI